MKPTGKKAKRAVRRLFRLCVVNGFVDEDRVRLVAKHVAESRRRGVLAVLANFRRLVKLDRDRNTARVESAAPLTDDVRDDIRTSLSLVYGARVALEYIVNPALIAGVRISIGSDVYDGSVMTWLTELEAQF